MARWTQGLLAVLVIAIVVACCRPALSWGLWLDETTMAWQAEAGFGLLRDTRFGDPAQSLLFGYIEAVFYRAGSPHMEALLRIPSVLGTIAGAFLVYRLAESLVGKGTGLLAMVPFVTSPATMKYTVQARPYTLAVAACLATLWGIERWIATGRRRYGLASSLAFALAVHLQMMFAVFAIIPAFVLWQRTRRGDPIDWRGLLVSLLVTGALLLPLIPVSRSLAHFPDPSAVEPPDANALIETIWPTTLLLGLVAIAFLLVPTGRAGLAALRASFAAGPWALLLFWLLAPPLVLFVASHLSHRGMLVERYFLYAAVAPQALIVAALVQRLPRAPATIILLACFLPYPFIYAKAASARADGVVSWRVPLHAVKALDPAAAVPVFVQSGHPPSNELDWQHGIEQHAFYYAPLTAYPIANVTYPLPFHLDDSVRAYVSRVAEQSDPPAIFVVGVAEHRTIKWVQQFFEARGYTATIGARNALWLVVLRKPTAPAP
jgi:hypothetical protein